MRFRYLGDKEEMTAFGYDFSNGASPNVTEPHVIAKLSGNRFFKELCPSMFVPTLGATIVSTEKKKPGRKPKQPTEA